MNKVNIVAEIGCNHKGSFNIAKQFLKVAADFCKAKYVKFQKRNPKKLLTDKEYNSSHPEPHKSYGRTYGIHREKLEFSLSQHKKLKNICKKLGLVYSSSVWDIDSTKEIISLKPKYIKIPSACNLNFKIGELLSKKYSGQIHISLGMTSRYEEKEIVNFYKKRSKLKNLVLYACTSGYPVGDNDVCLLEISRLIKEYGKKVSSIGFSGHHAGIGIDVAAVALGAVWIERHFTLNRVWKGTDHAASLEPDGLRRLIRNCNATVKALKFKSKPILGVEKFQRSKLKKIVKL